MGVAERRERERQARKEAILDAARGLLLEKGLRGMTTREIADRCELSEATLFFYFRNKDEILLCLLFESIQFWAEGLEKLERTPLDAQTLLDRIWQFHEAVHGEHPEYYVLSAYLAQANALTEVSDEIREQVMRRSGENFRRLAGLLERVAGPGGGMHLADAIWSLFLGLMVLRDSRINLGHKQVRVAKRDRAAAFDILKRGLLATGKAP